MKKVSVIIPVYKVEQYLDRCVESVVNQTYQNLEIILVDDGSPDKCPQMCDDWAKKDKRIKVIHKENGGLSDARNVGIRNSTGDYIGFVDSDDYIDLTMYEKLVDSIESKKSDMSMAGINYTYDNKILKLEEINLEKAESQQIFSYLVLSGKKETNGKLYTENIMCAVWRCLYKKELIREIKFEKDLFCEDVVFTLMVLKNNPKISIVKDNLYFYYQREGSILHYYNEKKLKARKMFIERSVQLLKDCVSKEKLEYYEFLQYELCFNEVALSKDKKLKTIFLKDEFLKGLNNKANYTQKKKNTKMLKYKVADFLIHHNCFFVYSKLVRLR